MRAIGLLILAVALFSCLDAVAKVLATRFHIPVTEVVWLRFVGQTFYMVLIFGIVGVPALLATKRLKLQLGRSVLMVTTTACNFFALQTLRLDQTVTIVFLAPLVVAGLAGPLLGEWIGRRRALAIGTGFIGVLIAMHPGTAPLSAAVIVSFCGMFAYALFMLLTRYLSAYDPPFVTLFYSMLAGTLVSAPFAIRDWVDPPSLAIWGLLACLGAFGGAGHMLFIYAYKLAPASTVSPFLYVQLVTMVTAGYFVFGDRPDVFTITGAGIVIASGIYLVHRERVTGRGRE
jgi:drug/metabolite transporter (DMT)-like permease